MSPNRDAYCTWCGAKLVPALTGLRCPRLGSCGRGGLLEGTGIEIVHTPPFAAFSGMAEV